LYEGEQNPPQTKSKLLVKAASLALLRISTKIDSTLIALGILSLLLALGFWPRRAMGSGILIIIMALMVAVLSRCFLIALIDISAFPAVFHDRMLPAEPLAISSAILSIYLFCTLALRRKPVKISISCADRNMAFATNAARLAGIYCQLVARS
jgi:hypothetical protein